jgi:hypothetical protein
MSSPTYDQFCLTGIAQCNEMDIKREIAIKESGINGIVDKAIVCEIQWRVVIVERE